MPECDFCNKVFPSNSKLLAHKNRKVPCNAIKKETECKVCNLNFKWPADLERHITSNKHKNNYNIYIQNYNDYSTNIHIDNKISIINTFENTNISKIDNEFIQTTYLIDNNIIEMFKEIEMDGCLSPRNEYFVYCFNYFIKIFSKLNFNIAFNENHNCRCVSFTISNNNSVEYQILSYDIILKEYTWETIDYNIFIEKFLNLMQNIDDKYNNADFKKVLGYIKKYKHKYIKTKEEMDANKYDPSKYCKISIETELLTEYNKFKKVKEDETDEAVQLARWREENRLELLRDAKQKTLIRNAIESQMQKHSLRQDSLHQESLKN